MDKCPLLYLAIYNFFIEFLLMFRIQFNRFVDNGNSDPNFDFVDEMITQLKFLNLKLACIMPSRNFMLDI